MFSDVVKVGVILFIWESVHSVIGAKLGCSRLPDPRAWLQREDRCYLVRNASFRKYVPGRDWCKTHCSDYATPNSKEENDWIRQKFKDHYTGKSKLWIGCNATLDQMECTGDTEEKYRTISWEVNKEPAAGQT